MTQNNDTLTLPELQAELRNKVAELRSADPRRISVLLKELQVLRVQLIVMREITNNLTDPNAYKEMNLLNRMAAGSDLEPELPPDEEEENSRDAMERRIIDRGGSPESAARIAKVLGSVLTERKPQYDTENEPAGPPEPEQTSKPH